ncbi:MAG: ribonuclease E/G [Alphaproteobacteria bacterium]|nr:ribonuclease E/G [Alphaproteobacteria bacterium]
MARELLISAGPGEWRAALLERGIPVELFVERGDRSEAGSVHLGRVARLLPALGAALVDIGDDRPAFLPQGEVFPRGKRLNEGERAIVQVRREAQAGKAARVTMAAILRGRLVELIVGRPGFKGGEALAPDERNQLLSLLKTLTHPSLRAESPLSRNAREGAERSEAGEGAAGLRLLEAAAFDALADEAAALARRWYDTLERAARLEPPARLDPAASFAAALAGSLPGLPDEILADDPAVIPELHAAFPDSVVAHLPETEWPIDLDAVFDEALSATLALPGGGSVHFEATRAGMLIDVDTGTPETGSPERTGLMTNLAATRTIARQIRLRNLGGGIVIDFVGLDSRSARDKVRAGLAEAIAPDPAVPQLLGWTRLGHFELVRPRRSRPLAEALFEPRSGGALVKTAVTVSHEVLRALRRAARAQPGQQWRVIVAPEVAAALAGPAADAVCQAEQRFARTVRIEADPGYHRERFQISAL